MIIFPVYAEEWNDAEGTYVPTNEVLWYRAVSADGSVFGWGETKDEARECLLRILWRIDEPNVKMK